MAMRTPTRSTALLMLLLTACHTWRTTGVEPSGLRPDERRVRVELANGEQLEIEHPVFTADSVAGTRHGAPVAVARSAVRRLAVERGSAAKTAALVTGIVLTLWVAAAASQYNMDLSGWDWGD